MSNNDLGKRKRDISTIMPQSYNLPLEIYEINECMSNPYLTVFNSMMNVYHQYI